MATTQNTWADPITVTLQGRQNTFHIAADRDIFVPAIVENLGPNPVTIVTPPTRLVLEGNESAAYVVFHGPGTIQAEGAKVRIRLATPRFP